MTEQDEPIEELIADAASGDADSAREVGTRFAYGLGVDRDEAEAIKWFRCAAEKGDLRATGELGFRLAEGIGIERDDVAARKLYRKAAAEGDAFSIRELGVFAENGRGGGDRDEMTAMELYRLAAEKGDFYAMARVGASCVKGRADERDALASLQWFRRLFQAYADSDPLSDYYHDWYFIGFDDIPWYERHGGRCGDSRRFSECANELANLFESGRDFARDESEEMKWRRLAFQKGSWRVAEKIGRRLARDSTSDCEDEEAIKWTPPRKKVIKRDAEAALGLGRYFAGEEEYNNPVVRDVSKAVKWYRIAAKKGSKEANCELGVFCALGLGTRRDPAEAIKLFRRASKMGSAKATRCLAFCFATGLGVE